MKTARPYTGFRSEKIIKAKRNIGIIKHLSIFLPLKTLDQMYNAIVRSHLDYCDIIYHEPSQQNQPPLRVTLNFLMEKVEKQFSTRQLLRLLVHGKAQIVPNCMRS